MNVDKDEGIFVCVVVCEEHISGKCVFYILKLFFMGFCFVSSRRFAVAAARSEMKVPFDLIIQRNDRNSSLNVGLPASCTACTLFGSGFIPFLLTLNPKKGISGRPRMHLLGLTVLLFQEL